MANQRKTRTQEEKQTILEKIRDERLRSRDTPTKVLCKPHGISLSQFYTWTSQAKNKQKQAKPSTRRAKPKFIRNQNHPSVSVTGKGANGPYVFVMGTLNDVTNAITAFNGFQN